MISSNSKQYRYRTYRQKDGPVGIVLSAFFLCNWCGFCLSDQGMFETGIPLIAQITIALLGIGWLVYSVTNDSKRNKYITKGKRFNGYILEAERKDMGRSPAKYYLLITFNDNGTKFKYTEAYEGDPNDYLKSRRCSIYKYKDKYIEADLVCKDNSEEVSKLNIPIHKYRHDSRKKEYV